MHDNANMLSAPNQFCCPEVGQGEGEAGWACCELSFGKSHWQKDLDHFLQHEQQGYEKVTGKGTWGQGGGEGGYIGEAREGRGARVG